MTRERASGAALIAGALAGLVTMALHPTGHDLAIAVGRSAWPARLNVIAHGLAIASSPLLFFGALGLTTRLQDGGLVRLALVTYGFALVAMMSAAIASGFVAPHLLDAHAGSDAAQRSTVDMLLHFNFQVNQAFAKVFVALSSVAFTLWALAILKTRVIPRWVGIGGCVVGPLVLLGLIAGHVRLNVHGFGAIVLLQSAWLIAVGVSLYRTPPSP